MEAVSIDTPIFDDETREKIGGALGKRLIDRFNRAVALRSYLLSQWGRFPLKSSSRIMEEPFQELKKHSSKRGECDENVTPQNKKAANPSQPPQSHQSIRETPGVFAMHRGFVFTSRMHQPPPSCLLCTPHPQPHGQRR